MKLDSKLDILFPILASNCLESLILINIELAPGSYLKQMNNLKVNNANFAQRTMHENYTKLVGQISGPLQAKDTGHDGLYRF